MLSHRPTVKIQEELYSPAGKLHVPSFDSDSDGPILETKIKIEVVASIRTIKLSADIGGLSLQIKISSLDGMVNLEQLELQENLQVDAENRIVQAPNRSSISVPTTRMEVDVKLKSITIDFIEAQSHGSPNWIPDPGIRSQSQISKTNPKSRCHILVFKINLKSQIQEVQENRIAEI